MTRLTQSIAIVLTVLPLSALAQQAPLPLPSPGNDGAKIPQAMQVQPAVQMVSAADPAGIVDALQTAGYRAVLETDSVGDPVIRSSAAGANFSVYFYGCADGGRNCTSVSLAAGFDLTEGTTAAAMNEWNSSGRFAYAYVDDEGDPFLNYDLNLDGGMPVETFKDSVAMWDSRLAAFLDHIDW